MQKMCPPISESAPVTGAPANSGFLLRERHSIPPLFRSSSIRSSNLSFDIKRTIHSSSSPGDYISPAGPASALDYVVPRPPLGSEPFDGGSQFVAVLLEIAR